MLPRPSDTPDPLLARERVSVFLGPGATFTGIADSLLTDLAAGGVFPTRDRLARALLAYNQDYLPAPVWFHHRVGLRLPLPIEIDLLDGSWIVNAADIETLADGFLPAWESRLRTPPGVLDVPDAIDLVQAATAVAVGGLPVPALALDTWKSVLRNPFDSVFSCYAVLHALEQRAPGSAPTLALAVLGHANAAKARLLAVTSAGNAVLRRFDTLLQTLPIGADPAEYARARTLLDGALRPAGPTGPLVSHLELPDVPARLTDRKGVANAAEGATRDPVGGLHRMVLGRDLAVGRPRTQKVAGVTTTVREFAGRVPLDPYLKADAALLNLGGDSVTRALLTLVSISPGLGLLDSVRAGGPEALTVGLDRWSATTADSLAALLFRLKDDAPGDFDLFFALHGLDVERVPGGGDHFRLLGMDATALEAPEWAARFRLAAVASMAYRRAQVQQVVKRLRATTSPATLRAARFGPFPLRPYDFPVDTAGSAALAQLVQDKLEGTAALPADGFLDHTRVAQPTAKSPNTFAGAVINVSDPGVLPVYGGFFDDETYYIGSMLKVAPMYVAYELRFRLQELINDATLHGGLNTSVANWEQQLLIDVEKVWFPQLAKGFPGLDTGPRQLPKWHTIFEFPHTGVNAGKIRFKVGGATDAQVDAVGAHGTLRNDMAFNELMRSMILWSHNTAAGRIIDALGLATVNSVLREAGFFDPKTKLGLWMSGNYITSGWKPGVDFMTLTARGKAHYKDTTNFVGNAKQIARLLGLAARKTLFDGTGAICDEMITMMAKKPPITWILLALEAEVPPRVLDAVSSKIGIGNPSPTSGLSGYHDCAIIARHDGGTPLRYIIVFIGGYGTESDIYDGFIQTLDRCIAP